MDLPDPWTLHKDTDAPSEEECKREMDEERNRDDPIEGEPCIICKTPVVMPRYGVTNLARGSEEVGVLCDDCGAKVTENINEKRTDGQ